jgi:ketosteroid isomerase-like protein
MSQQNTAVLAANALFYEAFAGRDVDKMERLWSAATELVCIHPGEAPLIGRSSVLASWVAILTNSRAPNVRCENPRAFCLGDVAFVTCTEVIEEQHRLIATNVFGLEGNSWKMIHHHASATPPRSMSGLKPDKTMIH